MGIIPVAAPVGPLLPGVRAPPVRGGAISTIEDVARLAGVSRGAVSNVLTGKVRMREATRRRVLEAAQRLGYTPNRAASALASGRYPMVAILIADITSLPTANLVKAVEEVSVARNHTVTICHTNKDPDRERAHLASLLGHRAAGLIAKTEGADAEYYARLLKQGTRVVLIDNPIVGLELPLVRFDRRQGVDEVVGQLVADGHRRIGAIVPVGLLPDRAVLRSGVERACARLGIDLIVQERPLASVTDGYDATRALLDAADPPTAVFATTWQHTLGMLAAVNELDERGRNRLALVGTGADEYLRAIAPWLTIVDVPTQAQGQLAAEHLFRLLDGAADSAPSEVILRPRLLRRRSTAQAPAPALG